MGGSDGKLCFSKKERRRAWKDEMERIMNEKMIWNMWIQMQQKVL